MLRMDTDGSYEHAVGGKVREDASSCAAPWGLGHFRVFPSSESITRRGCARTKLGISRPTGAILVNSRVWGVANSGVGGTFKCYALSLVKRAGRQLKIFGSCCL